MMLVSGAGQFIVYFRKKDLETKHRERKRSQLSGIVMSFKQARKRVYSVVFRDQKQRQCFHQAQTREPASAGHSEGEEGWSPRDARLNLAPAWKGEASHRAV